MATTTSPCSTTPTVVELIREKLFRLREIMDPDNGLLEQLVGLDVLTAEQAEKLRSEAAGTNCHCGSVTAGGRVERLLQMVLDCSRWTVEKTDGLIMALDRTNQRHVINYLLLPATEADNVVWPLDESTRRSLAVNSPRLVELIDPCNGLLTSLTSVGCLTRRQKQSIEACRTDAAKNALLLELLARRSAVDVESKFRDCLYQNGQGHVAAILFGAAAESDASRALGEDQTANLVNNSEQIVDLLDVDTGLLCSLKSTSPWTGRQIANIESGRTSFDRGELLLDGLLRGSQAHLATFESALINANQSHVVRLLHKHGVVVELVVTLTDDSFEVELVSTLLQLIAKISSANGNNVELNGLELQLKQELNKLGVAELLNVVIVNSVGLYFFFTSLEAVKEFKRLFDDDFVCQVITDVVQIFYRSDAAYTRQQEVAVKKLVWNSPSYDRCVQYFDMLLYADSKLSITNTLRYVRNNSDVDHISCDCEQQQQLQQLPWSSSGNDDNVVDVDMDEPLQTPIEKHSVQPLLTSVEHKEPGIGANHNPWIQPLRLLGRLDTTALKVVVDGIDHLDGHIYVVSGGSSIVRTFNDQPPYRHRDDVDIEGMLNPADLVACRKTSRLYIADMEGCIWQIDNKQQACGQWIPNEEAPDEIKPVSLSIRDTRLLITDNDHGRLTLYDHNGQLKQTIVIKPRGPELRDGSPARWLPYHAVETQRSTVVVCYSVDESKGDQVCEIDMDGTLLRSFEYVAAPSSTASSLSALLSWPSDLTLDDDGRVLVADRGNHRILLLDDQLRLERVLLTSDCDPEASDGRGPRRLRLGPKDGQLVVCLSRGVGVFGF